MATEHDEFLKKVGIAINEVLNDRDIADNSILGIELPKEWTLEKTQAVAKEVRGNYAATLVKLQARGISVVFAPTSLKAFTILDGNEAKENTIVAIATPKSWDYAKMMSFHKALNEIAGETIQLLTAKGCNIMFVQGLSNKDIRELPEDMMKTLGWVKESKLIITPGQ